MQLLSSLGVFQLRSSQQSICYLKWLCLLTFLCSVSSVIFQLKKGAIECFEMGYEPHKTLSARVAFPTIVSKSCLIQVTIDLTTDGGEDIEQRLLSKTFQCKIEELIKPIYFKHTATEDENFDQEAQVFYDVCVEILEDANNGIDVEIAMNEIFIMSEEDERRNGVIGADELKGVQNLVNRITSRLHSFQNSSREAIQVGQAVSERMDQNRKSIKLIGVVQLVSLIIYSVVWGLLVFKMMQ